jgi:preprotein translocase SecE subunit
MSRVTEFPDEEEALREEPEGSREGVKLPLKMPKLPLGARIREFYHAIKLEMAKTTWPTRSEVWSTTVVVLIAIVFFGFYLWGVDRLVTVGFQALEKAIR